MEGRNLLIFPSDKSMNTLLNPVAVLHCLQLTFMYVTLNLHAEKSNSLGSAVD